MPRKRRKHAEMAVYFQDQAPRIGSGWRGINVVTLGRKWVRIESHASGKTARLSLRVWNALLASKANQRAAQA